MILRFVLIVFFLVAACLPASTPASIGAQAPASGTPALWEVVPAKGGKAKMYLFGTFHALPKGLTWRTKALDKAIRRSDRLVTEVIIGEAAKPAVANDVASIIRTQGFTSPDKAAFARLSEDQRAKLLAISAAQGLPADIVPRMKPWLASLIVTQSLIVQAGFDPALGADEQLHRWFGKKPNEGLETVRQQMEIFATLDAAAADQALTETFSESATSTERLNAMAAIWASGDAGKLKSEFYDKAKTDYPDFFAALLIRRNQNWLAPLENYLAQKAVTFVAVGGGHLVGEEGLIALLEAKGYRIRQVQP